MGGTVSDQFDDLKRLAEMREKGEITDAEYDKIKAELMGEMRSEQVGNGFPEEAPRAPGADGKTIENQTRWWLIGTGVLMAVGSFMPWAQAGIFSVAGTSGDGVFTLIGGVIVALVGIANRASLVTAVGTVAVAGFCLYIVANVFGNFGTDVSSAGTGLFVTGLASLIAIIGGLKVFGQARR
jgi:hypothetical protein